MFAHFGLKSPYSKKHYAYWSVLQRGALGITITHLSLATWGEYHMTIVIENIIAVDVSVISFGYLVMASMAQAE